MKKFQYDTFPKPYAHFVKIDYKLTRHDILGIIIALTHQGSLFFFFLIQKSRGRSFSELRNDE